MIRGKTFVKKMTGVLLSAVILTGAAGWTVYGKTEAGKTSLSYSFASREEGIDLIMGDRSFFERMNQDDRDYRVEKQGATQEELRKCIKDQILDFSEEEEELVGSYMEDIRTTVKENGYILPPLDEIRFVKMTSDMEGGAATAFTLGTQIYLNEDFLQALLTDEEQSWRMEPIFAHELFHCLTRCNPDFRKSMYKILHFTVQDEEFTIPDSVEEHLITNPDVERHDASAVFLINGEPVECFVAFITTKPFEEDGGNLFENSIPVLVPVDGRDMYYTIDEASNFDEVFGENTCYVIDPEECLADNFAYALTYGMDREEGAYPDPQIIESILEELKSGSWQDPLSEKTDRVVASQA